MYLVAVFLPSKRNRSENKPPGKVFLKVFVSFRPYLLRVATMACIILVGGVAYGHVRK